MESENNQEQQRLIAQLRERMLPVPPLPGEDDFFLKNETLVRFLKARDWSLEDAEKQLKDTVEWRRQMNPLNIDCHWCHDRPGYHCVRQIGFDKINRPVIYACFSQAACTKTTVEDTVVHMTNLIENAKRTMIGDASTWVFIMDCTGMTLPACNPRVGYGITHAMSTYYPERLGLVVCIHHSPVFQGVWNAFKVFLHPNTVAKMQLLRKKSKFEKKFRELFDEELASWVMEEVRLNKQRPLPQSQREFWKAPDASAEADRSTTAAHDPRGCPSYVRTYVDTFLENSERRRTWTAQPLHQPHPNIIDALRGTLKHVEGPMSPAVVNGNGNGNGVCAATNYDSDDDTESEATTPLKISEEFQIPKEVLEQHEKEMKQQKKK